MPNRTPIRLFATCVIASPGRPRGILADGARTERNRARALDSAAHETRIRIVEERRALGRPMEFLWFGDRGRPVLMFPTSMGRFYQNEDFGLTGALADKVDAGYLQLVCVDSVDEESWYNKRIHPRDRARRHDQYDRYLRDEMLPFIESPHRRQRRGGRRVLRRVPRREPRGRYPGASRRRSASPGLYDVYQFLDGYWDETCYYHTPHGLHREHGRRLEREAPPGRVGRRDRRERFPRAAEPRVRGPPRAEGHSASRRSSGRASSGTTGRSGRSTSAGSSDAVRGFDAAPLRALPVRVVAFWRASSASAFGPRIPFDAASARQASGRTGAKRVRPRRDLERVLEVAAALEQPRERDADLPRLAGTRPAPPAGAPRRPPRGPSTRGSARAS